MPALPAKSINTETGQVKVLSCAIVSDMGQPINPKMCEQQMDGGMGMGIGDSLYEEMKMVRGVVTNPNFTDYHLPSASQMPPNDKVKTMIAPVPHRDGPFGAKGGFGEGALMGIQPAIGNAIYHATRVRIKDLPITPEKVLQALRQKE